MSNKIDITEAIVNELQKFNEADTSKYATSSNISALAKFLENSVKGLIESQEGCYEKRLDSNLSVFVGWSDGYSPEPDTTIIQSKNDPTFAINAGIKSNHDYMKTDYDWLNYPYNPETGDVWDTGVTISPNENYEETAKWLLEQYAEILEELNNNNLVLETKNKKLKESITTDNEESICSVCHSDNIEYGSLYVDDYGVVYPFICNSCGAEGNEYYDMTFSEIIDNYTDVSSTSEGVCPKCGSDLDYGSLILDGMDIYYEVECSNCDFVGKEWYDLSYAGQEIKNKKQEARSHKDANEKAAPRTRLNKNGKEVKTTDIVNKER